MSLIIEYAVFGALMAANVALGLYFACRKARARTTEEMFLGSRTLKVLPLAVSVVATVTSPTGIVAFAGHYYAYGLHLNWVNLGLVVVLPVTTHLVIPVLYKLRVTSVFEYLRMRYGAKTGLTACGICFILMIILLSIASNDGAHMLDDPQDTTELIVLEPTTEKQWLLGPILVDLKLGALGVCQHWSSATMPLQKPLSHASHSRHATTAMMERSDIFLLQQSSGAVAIFAASITITTIFQVPFVWSCFCIGATGTIYTALGGLRGVVWMDCLQAALTLLAPVTIIFKIIYDSYHVSVPLRPLTDFDVRPYFFKTSLDLTQDENVWSCFLGLAAMALYSSSLAPSVAQRYLAAKTLRDAQRTASVGTLLSVAFSCIQSTMALALIFWYRDCDPLLSGSIRRIDQILPFYVKQNLSNFPGFSGLFLAGIVCAATSTISSTINSLAAICYVDVVSQNFIMSETQAMHVTKGLALAIGAVMTAYSILIPYMGSASRIIMMVASTTTGPFVALFLLAFIFPFVNSKGAGIATILMVAFQLLHMFVKLSYHVQPPRMPVSLDSCPGNVSSAHAAASNTSSGVVPQTSYDVLGLSQLSSYWSNLFSSIVTILLGLAISACTGTSKSYKRRLHMSSNMFVKLWSKMKLIQRDTDITNTPFIVDLKKPKTLSPEKESMLQQVKETKI